MKRSGALYSMRLIAEVSHPASRIWSSTWSLDTATISTPDRTCTYNRSVRSRVLDLLSYEGISYPVRGSNPFARCERPISKPLE